MTNKQISLDIHSCGFVDPQAQLAAALADRHIREFRIALDMGAEPTLLDDKHSSIFEKALKTHGCKEYVDECLRRGCNPNYVNHHINKSAINFAADSKDPNILGALLRYKGVHVDHKYANLTAMNSLAKNITPENVTDNAACIKHLLNYGASPNIPDQREMTPVLYVIKNRKLDTSKKRELIQLFLDYSEIDLDTYRDGEARQLLESEFSDLTLPKANLKDADINIDTLLSMLRNLNEEKFLQSYREYQLNISDKDNLVNTSQEQNIQLLIESVKRGMIEAQEAVVQTGIDINLVHNGNTPIEVATIWGNWMALRNLLDHEDLKLRPQENLLITIIKKLDETPFNSFCNYNKCLYLLLDSDKIDINECDSSGSTPLHYAVKYRNRTAIQELLKRGASIGAKNIFDSLPIDEMQPDILEEHFDSCISTNGLKPGDESFEILINYKNLVPSQKIKHRISDIYNLREEMTPIAFLAESKEHRYLLQHPLITSFLFLKWHRLSVVFYINFLIYTVFSISIAAHTILKFRESENQALTTFLGLISCFGIGYMIVREFIQFLMSPQIFFRSAINYMELALIVLATMTVSENSYDKETQRVVAVFTILFVSVELCLLVGSLPVLSISTHMLMLRAVSKSFLKSFTLYSIFVVTFSICFYILFGKPEAPIATNGNSDPTENGEFNKFSSPIAAVIKTIVMLTGEFDAGDIDFNSLYSYLVFLMFVIFMSIVLFNLLNGLAVSDTQTIKSQAELNGSICRANLLTRYEEVLIGKSGQASFVIKHEPFRTICKRLMNLFPHYIAGQQIAVLPNNHNRVLIPVANTFEMKDMLERGNGGIRNSKTTFLPLHDDTDRKKKLLDPPVQFLPCCCSCITGKCSELDSRTVKLALAVIDRKNTARKDALKLQDTDKRLKTIEEKIEKMFDLLQDILAK